MTTPVVVVQKDLAASATPTKPARSHPWNDEQCLQLAFAYADTKQAPTVPKNFWASVHRKYEESYPNSLRTPDALRIKFLSIKTDVLRFLKLHHQYDQHHPMTESPEQVMETVKQLYLQTYGNPPFMHENCIEVLGELDEFQADHIEEELAEIEKKRARSDPNDPNAPPNTPGAKRMKRSDKRLSEKGKAALLLKNARPSNDPALFPIHTLNQRLAILERISDSLARQNEIQEKKLECIRVQTAIKFLAQNELELPPENLVAFRTLKQSFLENVLLD